MRVLVTGVAGFLGSWIASRLIENNHEVIGIDDLSSGYQDNIPPGVQFLQIDITSYHDMQVANTNFGPLDVVYHCAATAYEGLSVFSPSLITTNIVTGTINTFILALKAVAKRFINCSSMARYGHNQVPYREIMIPNPVDPYGAAKVAAEQQLNILGRVHGMTVVHAVPHNIIGPRQKYDDPFRNVAAIMINLMLQGRSPVIYGDGEQVRCFSYIDDVLPVMLALLDAPVKHGEVFNVGPDEDPVNINSLFLKLVQLLEFQGAPKKMPARPCEVKEAWCSSDLIRRRFGYRTKTELLTGLREMIKYISTRGPMEFTYHLPIEIDSPLVPRTWKEKLF